MPRGQRQGNITKENLVNRLRGKLSEDGIEKEKLPTTRASLPCLLGHAIFYGLVSEHEISETVPRMETTIACYLRSILSPPRESDFRSSSPSPLSEIDLIDNYVKIASRMYTRGTYIANFVAMYLYGERMPPSREPELVPVDAMDLGFLGREMVRYDREMAFIQAKPLIDFLMPRDVRNSDFKQVFLPERWPTRAEPLNSTISDVLRCERLLPPEPEGWRECMNPTGWDNSINRMATKLHANLQVHCRAGLPKRTAEWLGQLDYEEVYDERTIVSMQQMLLQRLRPLTIDSRDYEMIVELRAVLGVDETDPTWYVPKTPPFTTEVIALHAFLTCYGIEARSYLPVARRSRKYTYLDVKIYDSLTSSPLSMSMVGGDENERRRKRSGRGSGEGGRSNGDSCCSRTLGDALGLTPSSFRDKRREIRGRIRQEISRRKQRRPNNPSIDRLKKKMKKLGRGYMHPETIVNSLETDGVGVRLCARTPIDMKPFVKAFFPEKDDGGGGCEGSRRMYEGNKKRGSKRIREEEEKTRVDEDKDRLYRIRSLEKDPPIFVGIDSGRKKLFVAAISKEGYKKPKTYVFTRSRYYSEMRYWRHQSWSEAQVSRREVAGALVAISRGGGYRNCDLKTWRASLRAERDHHDVLDEEFVEKPDYAIWKMRLHRLKRASLDRATGELVREATWDQSPRRLLLLGMGNASFSSTGKGEISSPTRAVTDALRRSLRRMISSTRSKSERKGYGGGRDGKIEEIDEFRSTRCCCACGSETESAPIQEEGTTMRSRRLRLCTECEPTAGKRRDRDVQGSRNMLWILQHEYYGGKENRPWYLSRSIEAKSRFSSTSPIPKKRRRLHATVGSILP